MSAPVLNAHDLRFSFPGHPVIDGASFHLHPQERVALVGRNGAGKTTLLHLLVGLHKLQGGKIEVFGKTCQNDQDFHEVRCQVGFLFQDPDDQLFCPTVIEDVAFGPLNLGQSPSQAKETALKALRSLNLDHLSHRITHRLSGGEKRLVSLAGVLAMEPKILLLDEPTNALDGEAWEHFVRHLEQLDLAMLFISHDMRFVERLATRAVQLINGKIESAAIHSHVHNHLHIHGDGMPDHPHSDPAPTHHHHPHD